jgi:hypothetical protein
MADLPSALFSIWSVYGPSGNNTLMNRPGQPMSEADFLRHVNARRCMHCHKLEHTFKQCPLRK